MLNFLIALLFLASFLGDVINSQSSAYLLWSLKTLILRGLSLFFLCLLLLHNLLQIASQGILGHLTRNAWNLVDLALNLTYASYFTLCFYYSPADYRIVGLQCGILLVFGIKINFYLRLFDSFGFLVQMIITTFRDIWSFILYFFILMSFIAF